MVEAEEAVEGLGLDLTVILERIVKMGIVLLKGVVKLGIVLLEGIVKLGIIKVGILQGMLRN